MGTATKPALSLRKIAAKLTALGNRVSGLRHAPPERFSGDGSTTAFAMPEGKTPWLVQLENAPQIEGDSDDFTKSFDGFVWTVTFAVAPGASTVILVYPAELI